MPVIKMVEPREAVKTVTFIDNYCMVYRDLFADGRSFEAFKYLHLGMISDLPRKSLPAIARAVGLANDQAIGRALSACFRWNNRATIHSRNDLWSLVDMALLVVNQSPTDFTGQ